MFINRFSNIDIKINNEKKNEKEKKNDVLAVIFIESFAYHSKIDL